MNLQRITGSLQEVFSTLGLALVSILRNKRRSFSMMAGMIVGGAILSMILIYSNVLVSATFDSAVENAPYEVRFEPKNEYNVTSFTTLLNDLQADKHVKCALALYGSIIGGFAGPGNIQKNLWITSEEIQLSGEFPYIRVIIVPDNFWDTGIGKKVSESLVAGNLKDLSSTGTIVVSESVASAHKLSIGSSLANLTMNVAVSRGDIEEVFSNANLRVVGIYKQPGSSAGIFSSAFSIADAYISESTVKSLNPAIIAQLEQYGMRFIAIQLDRTQFNFGDLETASEEIDQFINTIEKTHKDFIGVNAVAPLLAPVMILSIFIQIFDIILAIPAFVLSLYLISFGIDLALEERRKEVQILKVAGGSPGQIRSLIRVEAILLSLLGIAIAYVLGTLGAWFMASGIGYMRFDFDAAGEITYYLTIDKTALFLTALLPGGVMIIQTQRKTGQFLEQEIVKGTSEEEWSKTGFLTRNKLDIAFLVIGFADFLINFLENKFGIELESNIWLTLLDFFGPLLLWIGGSIFIVRIVKLLPRVVKPSLRKIGWFKDVRMLVGSSLQRGKSDLPRLGIIIALTLSLAMLAAIQGTTGEYNDQRYVEWQVGADLHVSASAVNYTYSQTLMQLVPGSTATAVTKTQVTILNDLTLLYSFDVDAYESIGIFHEDSMGENTTRSQLTDLDQVTDLPLVLMGRRAAEIREYSIGDVIDIDIPLLNVSSITYPLNFSALDYLTVTIQAKIAGLYDHLPGGIDSFSCVMDQEVLLNTLGIDTLPSQFQQLILTTLAPPSFFLMSTPSNTTQAKAKAILLNQPEITEVLTLDEQLNEIRSVNKADFGIPGLLSANFIVGIFSATLATFVLMSLLMDSRKKEFGIIRAIGGSSGQIQKIAIAEISAVLLASILWGALLGITLSYAFNGLFVFMSNFINPTPLARVVYFPSLDILATLVGSFFSMILATVLSILKASKVPVVEVLHEL